ncbi:MAG: hypothetical protein KI788_03980 [Mameliella sp.]|nr:hypothetical protein [Mameliella sp.]
MADSNQGRITQPIEEIRNITLICCITIAFCALVMWLYGWGAGIRENRIMIEKIRAENCMVETYYQTNTQVVSRVVDYCPKSKAD